jgi:hypothetical protein
MDVSKENTASLFYGDFLLWLLFNPEDEDDVPIRKVG